MEILSEYELGRLIALIEWVVRGGKPIADCGSRHLNPDQIQALQRDLTKAIELSGEKNVHGYIIPHEVDETLYEFGVFVHDWALEARIHLEKNECPDWLQGIVFGYSSDAIQGFIKALMPAPSTTLPPCDGQGRVESVRLCSTRSPYHNHSHDRYQKSG